MKKEGEVKKRKCPQCGKLIEDIDINYCPACENILWSKQILGKKY